MSDVRAGLACLVACLALSLPGVAWSGDGEGPGPAGGKTGGSASDLDKPIGAPPAGQPQAEPSGPNMVGYYKEWRSRLEEVLDGLGHGENVVREAEEEFFDYLNCDDPKDRCEHQLKTPLVPFEKALKIVAAKDYPRGGLFTVQSADLAGGAAAKQEALDLMAKLNDQADSGNYYVARAAARAAELRKRYGRIREFHAVQNFKAEECSEVLAETAGLRESYLLKLKNVVGRHKLYWEQLEPYLKQP